MLWRHLFRDNNRRCRSPKLLLVSKLNSSITLAISHYKTSLRNFLNGGVHNGQAKSRSCVFIHKVSMWEMGRCRSPFPLYA